ncbi:MAG: hypothetical protein M9916_02910 [Crocinitomicaceae bacterium]|nr:hypothetical protein [Crocinitomicaceae bacterium]
MQQTYNLLEDFPETSKIWVYHNQGAIPKAVQPAIQEKLTEFSKDWASHGDKLYGGATILDDYFILFLVNEEKTIASGCSVDSSIHFLRRLEKEYNLNFLDRMNVVIEENGQKKNVHYSEINNHKGAIYFDPTLRTLGEFKNQWKKVI